MCASASRPKTRHFVSSFFAAKSHVSVDVVAIVRVTREADALVLGDLRAFSCHLQSINTFNLFRRPREIIADQGVANHQQVKGHDERNAV